MLGTLLFSILLTIFAKLLNFQFLLFADDTKSFRAIESPKECYFLQDDTDFIVTGGQETI